jgi:hypothetical protein
MNPGNGTGHFQEISSRHVRYGCIGETIGTAMTAFEIAALGAFPEQISEGMEYSLILPEPAKGFQKDPLFY